MPLEGSSTSTGTDLRVNDRVRARLFGNDERLL